MKRKHALGLIGTLVVVGAIYGARCELAPVAQQAGIPFPGCIPCEDCDPIWYCAFCPDCQGWPLLEAITFGLIEAPDEDGDANPDDAVEPGGGGEAQPGADDPAGVARDLGRGRGGRDGGRALRGDASAGRARAVE